MEKLIWSDANDAMLRDTGGIMMRIVNEDGLVKAAASEVFGREMLSNYRPERGKFAAHLIAMGADEFYGFNRNGDTWMEEDLIRDHPTFAKHGHFFREHLNHDPKLKIGDIKAAAYNPHMHRVELIVHGDQKLAEQEYQMAKEGKAIAFSMASKVPYDVCSCCHNKSASIAKYCPCLKQNMTRYVPKFRKYAYAINPKNRFFDISAVGRPADRTAFYLDYMFGDDHMAKAACVGNLPVIGGAQMAKAAGLVLPDATFSGNRLVILQKLAAEEKWISKWIDAGCPGDSVREELAKEAGWLALDNDVPDEEIARWQQHSPEVLIHRLSKKAAVLPLPVFARYIQQRDPEVIKAACGCMGDAFTQLEEAGPDAGDMFAGDDGLRDNIESPMQEVQDLMDAAADKFSCKAEPSRRRTMLVITIKSAGARPELVNPGTSNAVGRPLASLYANYVVSAIEEAEKRGHTITSTDYLNVVARNFLRHR